MKSTCQLDRHDRLVVVRELVVHGHDYTISHDCDDDDPLEGRPVDQPGHQFAHWTGGSEEEERGWATVVRLIFLLLSHLAALRAWSCCPVITLISCASKKKPHT